jgi:hypothetical protein
MKTTNIVLQFTNSGDMTGTITSQPISMEQVFGYSVELLWTGSPVGTISLQYSDDMGPINGGPAVTNWATDTTSTQNTAPWTGFVWNVRCGMYGWARVIYVPTGGSGTLTGKVETKGG